MTSWSETDDHVAIGDQVETGSSGLRSRSMRAAVAAAAARLSTSSLRKMSRRLDLTVLADAEVDRDGLVGLALEDESEHSLLARG